VAYVNQVWSHANLVASQSIGGRRRRIRRKRKRAKVGAKVGVKPKQGRRFVTLRMRSNIVIPV
jgi:hypothetical protein